MNPGLVRLFVMIGILLAMWSRAKGQSSNTDIVTKITQLEEFKVEQTRIDSLKQTGQNVDIAISIIKGSLDTEDKGKDIFSAFISEDFGFTETILYTIKFNSKTEEIISIKSNKRE